MKKTEKTALLGALDFIKNGVDNINDNIFNLNDDLHDQTINEIGQELQDQNALTEQVLENLELIIKRVEQLK